MTNSIIKILLIGEYSIFRSALRMLIETDSRLRVVGEADELDAASKIVSLENPDLVLADLPYSRIGEMLPAFSSIEPPVLVLVGGYDVEVYKKCLQLGISGLVLKEESADTLFKAIEKIHEGELWFDRTIMGETIRHLIDENKMQRQNPQQDPAMGLTDREKEVIDLLCVGKKTKDIADELYIAQNTVRHHLTSVFHKLEIKGRLELVIYAFKNGLVKIPNGTGSNGNGRPKTKKYSSALNA